MIPRRRHGLGPSLLLAATSLLAVTGAEAEERTDRYGFAALQQLHKTLASGAALPAEYSTASGIDFRVLNSLRDPLWEQGAFWLHTTPKREEVAEHQVRDGAGASASIRLLRSPVSDATWVLDRVEHLDPAAFLPHEGSNFLFADPAREPRSASEALRRCWMRGYETRRDPEAIRSTLGRWFDLSKAQGGVDDLVALLGDGLREPVVHVATLVSGRPTVLRVESELGFRVRRVEVGLEWPSLREAPRVTRASQLEDGTVVESLDAKSIAQFHDLMRQIREFGPRVSPPPVVRLRGTGPLCTDDPNTAASLARAASDVLRGSSDPSETLAPSAVRELGVTVISAFVKTPRGDLEAIECIRVGDRLCLRSIRVERQRLSYGIALER